MPRPYLLFTQPYSTPMRRFASLPALLLAATLLAAGVLPSVLHACRMIETGDHVASLATPAPCHDAGEAAPAAEVDAPSVAPSAPEPALACCAWRVAPAPVAPVGANPLPQPHVATIAYEPAAIVAHPTTSYPSHLADPPDPERPARHLRFSQLLI